jgi:opine dehydrogenase
MNCSIVGAGNGGLAFAGLMAKKNLGNVTVYDVDEYVIAPLREKKTIQLISQGQTDEVGIFEVTNDPQVAVADSQLIMVVTPASFHADVARSLSGCIKSGAVVVLNPGRTGGAIEFVSVLQAMGCARDIVVAEAQTLLFACRKKSPVSVEIKGIKKSVPVAALPSQQTSRVLEMLNAFFPQFIAAENVLETSLNNIGAIFHPAPTLLNAARIECGQMFQYYLEGITPAVAAVLEEIDKERVAIANAFGVKTQSALQWLNKAYGLKATSLYEAIQSNESYQGIKAPTSIRVRYVTEDVPTGLVPLMELAGIVGVAVPSIRAIVRIANGMLGEEYEKKGRTLLSMGIAGLSVQEIRQRVS